jgi:Holliday junction resolvase
LGYDTEVSALYLHSNSGATGWKQNDLTRGILSVECKETAKKSYTIKQEELYKCIRHADEQMQMPALVFRFSDNKDMFAVIRYDDLLQLVEKLSN